jgi:hypothetical protein
MGRDAKKPLILCVLATAGPAPTASKSFLVTFLQKSNRLLLPLLKPINL